MKAPREQRALKLAAVVAGAVIVLAIPLLVTDRYILKVATLVGVYVIVIVGLALLFGYAGQVSLGHAAFFGIGAYTSAYLTAARGLPWVYGVAGAIIASSVAGLVVALPSLRLRGHYLAMATLGFNEIMSVAFVEARAITGGNDGLGGIPFPAIGPFEVRTPGGLYLLVWGVALVCAFAAGKIVAGRPGRAMRALHCGEPGALACGIDVAEVKARTFVVSAGIAGLAGSLYGHSVGFISPSTFGLDLSIILVAAVVLGGRESLAGPMAAVAVLTALPYAGALVPGLSRPVAEFVQDIVPDVVAIMMISTLILQPNGLAYVLRRRTTRVIGGAER